MQLETGVYGAKVQSWKRANPRDLLKRVLDDNPGISLDEAKRIMRDQLKEQDKEDYLDAVIDYWTDNNYRALVNPAARQEQRVRTRAVTRERVEEIKGRVVERIKEKAREMLLDMTMPNGKPLRDCTGKYCSKLGGWLSRVGDKAGARKVGDVLSEAELRKLRG